MNKPRLNTRYNRHISDMRVRAFSGSRPTWLMFLVLGTIFCPPTLFASNLGDEARQLAHKIASTSGPGTVSLGVTNHSSLDEKSVHEVRRALEDQLSAEGVHTAGAEQAMGVVTVVLSESLREYVWTAEITIGSDEKKIAMVSLPRAQGTPLNSELPMVLKTTFLFAREHPMLDVAVVEMPGGPRLLALGNEEVAIYRRPSANPTAVWELEISLPIAHSRSFPRDLRGRLLLRHDHLFDAYLPGTFCRSNSSAPLTIFCNDSDDPWPLSTEAAGLRAFFSVSRNFFTGALSPGIGKISNVPAFYSAGALPRANYTLWALIAVDGSLHLVDGMTDQAIRGVKWGSDLAAVRSSCGIGAQLIVSQSGDEERDGLQAFEMSDREPMAVSAVAKLEGRIVALWEDSSGTASAIVKRKDTGWYEAYRVSISCGN